MTPLNDSSQGQLALDDRRFVEDLLGFLAVLRRGWHFIAVSTVVCLTLTALYLAQIRPVYKSSTRLLILQQGGRPLSNIVSGGREILEAAADEIPTHVMVIRSPVVLDRAVALARVKGLTPGAIIGGLSVYQPDPSVKILELGFQGESSEEATRVVDAVVASYRKFLEENYQKNTTDVLGLIAKVRDDLSDELKELEQKYLEFHRQHPVFTLGGDGRSLLVRRLDQWDEAANEANMRAVKLQSQLDLARKLSGEGAGLATIGNTIRFLGSEKEESPVAGLMEGAPEGSSERLGAELAGVERQRRTVERLLDHLRSERADATAAKPVSEAEVAEAFFADPEAARLREQLDAARNRRAAAQRVIRNPGDPSLTQLQRRVKALEAELDRLWQRRRGAIVELLCRGSASEIDAALRREEANLIVLKSQESVLREELEARPGTRHGGDGPATLRPTVALAADAGDAPSSGDETAAATATATATPAATERPEEFRVRALIDAIERGLRANEVMRAEMARRFKEELAAGKEAEIERLEEEGLRADLDRHRTLFNSVVDQLKQARLVSDHTMITAQTISPTSSAALRPRSLMLLVGSLLAGCSLGVGLAYLVDMFDARLRTLPALRRVLEFPVLGLIPQLPGEKRAGAAVGLISHAQPLSLAAEAYKSIRTNIEFHRRQRHVQVILVTSPHSGDGKSTTASNLAISLAQSGKSVLLVDADLRRPSLHTIHHRERTSGLTLFLKDLLPLKCVIQPTAIDHLSFLAAGPGVSNPAELLGSPRFREFLAEVRQSYDMIVLDSSPLLAVTDPLIIGAVSDGVVLVARALTLHRHEGEQTAELLTSVGAPVLGTVVNGFTREQSGHGYSQGYGYGYGYGYGRGYGEVYTGVPGAADAADGLSPGEAGPLPALESAAVAAAVAAHANRA
jgi:capsular exopolysaccharide synthesis family protein